MSVKHGMNKMAIDADGIEREIETEKERAERNRSRKEINENPKKK